MANPVAWFEINGPDGGALQSFYAQAFDWAIDASNEMNYGMVAAAQGGIPGGVSPSPDGSAHATFYVAVDDVGRAVNPLIIHGQVHGGIAQGIGQALLEHAHYDPESGQMLAGSFMDYAMPRASDLPSYITELSEVPSSTHPLGIRPAGEGGTVPALAVVINAVVDALWDFGVRHVEMPATPQKVWQAIRDAKAAQPH